MRETKKKRPFESYKMFIHENPQFLDKRTKLKTEKESKHSRS